MQNRNNGESKGFNRLYSEHLLMPSREEEAEQLVLVPWKTLIPIVEDCISKKGINSVQQVIGPIMEDSIRKVNAEIQSVIYQNRNFVDETTTPIPSSFKLKFSGTVPDTVYTGREIKGKEGTDIKIALVHSVTGELVDSGPLSTLTVEIFIHILKICGVEDFNDSIIKAKNNPHFRKPIRVKLEKGIGILPKNVKLGHNSRWLRRCKCSLGARVVQKFDGSRIEEASIESFTVLDQRSSLYKKHDQPFLRDEVWRLKNIGKNGARHNRLLENNISTVQEFLWLLANDPRRLQEIFDEGHPAPAAWRDTVDHARKCHFDENKMYSEYPSSSICKNGVVFDVGQQKGVLPDDSCVPIESVAEAEKDDAWKSLAPAFENQNEAPAFENWNNMPSFDDEASRNFPCTSNDKNAANSNGLDGHLDQYFVNWNDMDFFEDDLRNFQCTSSDKNVANSTGLDGHLDQYFVNWNDMDFFNDDLRNFQCTSSDKNVANSTGLDGRFGQYFENAEILNEQPFGFPENVPNSLNDHFRLWNFNDGHELSL